MKRSLTFFLTLGVTFCANATYIPDCNEQTKGDRIAVPDQKLIDAAIGMGWTREEAESHDGSVRVMYCTLTPNTSWLRSASEDGSLTIETLQNNSEYRWVLL